MVERLWTRSLLGLPEDHVEEGRYQIKDGRVITEPGLSFRDWGDRGAVAGKSVDDIVGTSYLFPQQTGVGLYVTRAGWAVTERLLNVVDKVVETFK